MSFFEELKRRNVFRVGIAYLVGAWLLIQLTDILLDNIGAPAWVLQTMLVALGVGFFITLFFAWAFEMTPEGVKREKDIDRSQSITPQTGKKLNGTILVLMALVISYLLFDKFSDAEIGSKPFSQAPAAQVIDVGNEKSDPAPNESKAVITRQSIAVLPFDNRSRNADDEFFVEGIHDDLLTNLARIGSLKVISRTSVMRYKDTEIPIPDIAAELGVATIMEGAVQRSGSTVRINVQLIDAKTDEHLWAEIYDRKLNAENLFSIQSEISEAIAAALEATLSPEEQQRINTTPTQNMAAYDAYLRGRQLMASRDSAKLKLATEAFTEAVELDPQFALAWVNLADSTLLLADYGTLSNDIALPIRKNAIGFAIPTMAYIELGMGDAQRALEIHLAHSPGWLEPDQWDQLIGWQTSNACVVAWLLINAGDAQLGNDLLARTTTYLDEALPAVIKHADGFAPELCYLTSGDTEKALDSLATQLAHNHLFGWDLGHQLPMYDLIRDEPRYLAMLAERERRIEVQREAVAQMDGVARL